IFDFQEEYFTYFPTATFSKNQGWGGQSFLGGYLGGESIGMINPDPHGDVLDGIFKDIPLATTGDEIIRNAIANAKQENDYLNFSPTPDTWYLKKDDWVMVHGLAELNPADGITLKLPAETSSLAIHYANVANHQGIYANQSKVGVKSVVSFTHDSLFTSYQDYYQVLKNKGVISLSNYPEADWWLEGIYCSWFETHTLDSPRQSRVETAVSFFQENDIKVGTIILDEGWAGNKVYGDWQADPDKYPNGLRSFIDDLHNQGYKVLLHFMPFSVSTNSNVYQEHTSALKTIDHFQTLFIQGDQGKFDYTNPRTREYLKERLRIMLSDDPDAYNADGLKVDFVQIFRNSAEYDIQYQDPEIGRGVDYLHYSLKWLYDTAKEIKSDAFISGFGVHPFFQDTVDAIRTGDFYGDIANKGLKRQLIKHILMPNVYSIFDLHTSSQLDFQGAAYGYASGIPHVVFKTGNQANQIQQIISLADAYDQIKHDLKMTNLDDPIGQRNGINNDGEVVWKIESDEKSVSAKINDVWQTISQ
ncbi:alpha-galactosidase, partial [Patescibacteria group bacterium]|nr:alpha-galactosidase [Patescibacteria group bacterium]